MGIESTRSGTRSIRLLELKRNEKVIGKSLEAKVQLYCSGELFDSLNQVKGELKAPLSFPR
jgi:hypothetical protein